jgi:hypothetical protein
MTITVAIICIAITFPIAFFLGRVGRPVRRSMIDDPAECHKLVAHYQRPSDKSINHIRTMYDMNERAAKMMFGYDTAEEAIAGDGVHQDFRDSIGFWRVQAKTARERSAER